tara:strand:+ start:156 stop:785 length:630 start_codon:yes stop_codon:yes gene_type:complete
MNPEEYWSFLINQFVPKGMNSDEVPSWVTTLKDKLKKTVYKEISKIDIDSIPKVELAGFLSGYVQQLEQKGKEFSSKIKVPKNTKLPRELEQELDSAEKNISDFVTKNEKQSQSSIKESVEFAKGRLSGLESLFNLDATIKNEALDTKLSLAMLMVWPLIHKKIKTRKQCFDLLTAIAGESVVGNQERVEKFFERIGYSPARVGRPKKS